jgi:tripartite-type tricarboxylate transporter receptor subunit TctC
VIETLNKQVNAALADEATRKRFTDLGCNVFSGTPEDFKKFIAAETAKWAKVVAFAGIKAD